MKAFKRFYLPSFGMSRMADALGAIDQMLDDLFQFARSWSPGKPVHHARCENIDGVWLVVEFAAATTDTTVIHRLGRVPTGMMLVESLPDPGETVVAGIVTLVTATKETVTLQTTGANKKARLILF